jgi:hypothetical protein
MEEARFKAILRETVAEVLEERRDYFAQIVEDVIEDLVFARHIDEGVATEEVCEDTVLKSLTRGASER